MEPIVTDAGDPTRDVDSAAIVLAGLAGAAALFGTDGRWDAVSLALGLVLVVVVLAFHRPVGRIESPRDALRRLAFGGVLGTGVALTVAWPVQEWVMGGGDAAPYRASLFVSWTLLGVAIVVAIVEPYICRFLDWTLPRKAA